MLESVRSGSHCISPVANPETSSDLTSAPLQTWHDIYAEPAESESSSESVITSSSYADITEESC